MITKYHNLIVSLACRVMVPFIFLYGIYIIFFGHYSPGGGFQGGTILAADVILMRLVLGKQASYKKFPPQLGLILGGIGLLIYGGTGLVALLTGGNFLDYSYLPIPGISEPERHYYGILFVEIGVALGVFGVLLSIFDSLTKEK
jgi:multicomponent Na+:H+ antiporter subunit B